MKDATKHYVDRAILRLKGELTRDVARLLSEVQENLAALDKELEDLRHPMVGDPKKEVKVTHINPKDAIYITSYQAEYMSCGDTWILGHSDDGWLLVGNGSVDPDAEGNGVWVDASGQEHHGPTG